MAGDFDFHERLGAGHFGEVWRVTDTGLNAVRALKLIPPAKVINPSNFFHEAQILQEVAHPNVVAIKETGEMADGRLYVAMDFLKKGSVEDEARGGYLPLTRAKRLMIDVLRGLEHAHRNKVLHRDVKPANILVGNTHEGILSDFGLAVPNGVDLKALGVKDYAYTLHLAPEISSANDHSVVSDVYASGMTLYRLVNGDAMLPAISPFELRMKTISGEFPDRQAYREFIPRPLRTLINKAIHIDPAARFSSADKMRHALEQITIEKNWSERRLSDGMEWICSWDDKCYNVQRRRTAGGNWDVVVRKGRTRKQLRRVNALCATGLTKTKAEQATRRILQDFVLGKQS